MPDSDFVSCPPSLPSSLNLLKARHCDLQGDVCDSMEDGTLKVKVSVLSPARLVQVGPSHCFLIVLTRQGDSQVILCPTIVQGLGTDSAYLFPSPGFTGDTLTLRLPYRV